MTDTSIVISHRRAGVVLALVSVVLLGLVARVAYLQTYGRQSTILKAENQHYRNETLPARRGSIFDAHGVLLACTIQNHGVFVDPKFMHERYQDENRWMEMEGDVRALAELLELNGSALLKMIADRSEERFIKISDWIDDDRADAIRKMKVPGVGLMPVNHRVYPMGSLAAHVIGGVGREQIGLEGLEMKYDPLLNGRDGRQRVLKDSRRRGIGVAEEDYIAPEHGQHLVLTIDANIQAIAEQELAATCEKFRAKRGEVVVLDPWTGDVLGLANYPTYNPQAIAESPSDFRTNATLVMPYEPGSTVKPFIVGPAMTKGITSPGSIWPITGISWQPPYGRRRPITDVHGYGPLTTWDVLVKSSNIGMSMLAHKMGNPAVHEAMASFGFGKATGIELPGEDRGMLRPLASWTSHSTDSIAQGYEMMVTPLQLARAFAAFANDGRLPDVRIVKGTLDVEGNVVSSRARRPASELPQVLAPETAATIRRILADVPVRGTATRAKTEVPMWNVWNVFGKTGTSHISEGRAGYSGNRYNSTFIGGAPYERPRLVIAMAIHEPDRSQGHYGGTVSGPGAISILARSLEYLQVEPSPELPLPPDTVVARLVNFQASAYRKTPARPPVRQISGVR